MVSRKITVNNPSGLHLRPAGNLCKEALKFKSKIELVFGTNEANAKSVLSVLGACVKCGDEVEFRCSGEDEQAALDAILKLTENGFGEET
jgi:phosphocarrier protein HPr